MEYIKSMIAALKKDDRSYNFELQLNATGIIVGLPSDVKLPTAILSFYMNVHKLKIFHPRPFEILSIDEMSWVGPFVTFSKINTNFIGFDCRKTNSAGEWDIISLETKFIITKTFASYITNKMWAWIDRRREVWCQD